MPLYKIRQIKKEFLDQFFRLTLNTSTSSRTSSSVCKSSLGKTMTFCTVPRSEEPKILIHIIKPSTENSFIENIYDKHKIPFNNVSLQEFLNVPALTCSQEEHLIAPISRSHLVDSNCGELVVHVGSDHQGALVHRVNGVVHGGVVSHEVDNLIWVILCGFHVGSESTSRTLLTDGTF